MLRPQVAQNGGEFSRDAAGEIRHRAAFRDCTKELLTLQQELVEYLLTKKHGLLGTDQMYFAVAADRLDGGAQITASHNPGEYNGCKMVRAEAFPLSGEAGIKEMKEMIMAGAIPAPPAVRGTVETRQIMDRYVAHVMSFIDASSITPFNVVLDAGSGVAARAPQVANRSEASVFKSCI